MPELPRFFIGIDPASETFAASIFYRPDEPGLLTAEFANDLDGFEAFAAWLQDHGATSEACIVCVEATGVYAEMLCYYLHEQGFAVALEGPHAVQRAFKTTGNKNDPADSRQIAEYAFRFFDELRPWQPKEALIEQIRTLLVAREQFVSQLSANRNLKKSLQRKVVETPTANASLEAMIAQLKQQIQAIEAEIKRLIRSDSTLSEIFTLPVSIPSVGLLPGCAPDGHDRRLPPRGHGPAASRLHRDLPVRTHQRYECQEAIDEPWLRTAGTQEAHVHGRDEPEAM